jgi:RecG-like helicase
MVTQQSGVLNLQIDLVRDRDILALAREKAIKLTADAHRNRNTPLWEQSTLSWPKEKYLNYQLKGRSYS